jgi:magnesium-transporting ATPase (P-type)
MPYFERVKKLSVWLIVISILFFLLTVIFYNTSNFKELIYYDINDKPLEKLLTLVSLLIAIFSLVLGIALRIVAIDAQEDLSVLKNESKS